MDHLSFKRTQHELGNGENGHAHTFGDAGIALVHGSHAPSAASTQRAEAATSLGWLYETQGYQNAVAEAHHAQRTGAIAVKAYTEFTDRDLALLGISRESLEPSLLSPMPSRMGGRYYLHNEEEKPHPHPQ
jgi:hypothetical protein